LSRKEGIKMKKSAILKISKQKGMEIYD